MKVDITELLIFFDEQAPATEEEKGYYWFRSSYSSSVVNLIFSLFEETCTISVYVYAETVTTSLRFNECISINILDQEKKCLEVLSSSGRCFLAIKEVLKVEYEDGSRRDL